MTDMFVGYFHQEGYDKEPISTGRTREEAMGKAAQRALMLVAGENTLAVNTSSFGVAAVDWDAEFFNKFTEFCDEFFAKLAKKQGVD